VNEQLKHIIIELQNLNVQIRNGSDHYVILKEVNLVLHQGETVALIGESGSGKSICALTILGLLPSYVDSAVSGNVLYIKEGLKRDLLQMNSSDWNQIRGKEMAMIFQDPNNALNPIQKCGKQIQEAVVLHHDLGQTAAKAIVFDLMKTAGLGELDRMYNSYPHQLSGGQLQRILIAIALAGKPKILIADEPTTNLDADAKQEILALMEKLKQELDLTILYITHDLSEAQKLADRFYQLRSGEVVSTGLIGGDAFKNLFDGQELSFKNLNSKKRARDKVSRPLLKVVHISKQFVENGLFAKKEEGLQVLKDVGFTINSGEILGIMGPSGSGKTTLGRVILNLEKADEGAVLYNEENIFDLDRKSMNLLRQKMQIVYQNPYNTLNPRMSIQDLVMEPLLVHKLYPNKKARLEAVKEMLNLAGISLDKLKHYTFQLSGGQRQRVAIARALIMKPEFVVLDECISSLDRSTQFKILDLLFDLKNNFNLSYLFISHDAEVVNQISDRVMYLKNGVIQLKD
jgi:ABC-type microcin C transport system duplicated ATPase subunit YejF